MEESFRVFCSETKQHNFYFDFYENMKEKVINLIKEYYYKSQIFIVSAYFEEVEIFCVKSLGKGEYTVKLNDKYFYFMDNQGYRKTKYFKELLEENY